MKRLIPYVLLFVWVLLTIVYLKKSEFLFFSLEKSFPIAKLDLPDTRELLKGRIATAEFTSKYQNFDKILLRFKVFDRTDSDYLSFRLKELGQNNWYFESEYEIRGDHFYPNKLFSFSFPKINNSVSKVYRLEIESLKGTSRNAIVVSPDDPVLLTGHSFTKSELFGETKLLRYFLRNKTISLLEDKDFLFNLIIFALPLMLYLLFLIFGFDYFIPSLLMILSVILDIFAFPRTSDYLWISIMFAWLLPVIKFKIDSKVSISLAIICLWATPIFLLANRGEFAWKTQVWLYLFLLFFVFHRIYELKKNIIPKISIHDFWKGLVTSSWNIFRFIYLLIRGEYEVAARMLHSFSVIYSASSPVLYKIGVMSIQMTVNLLQKIGHLLQTIILVTVRLIPFYLLLQIIIKVSGYSRAYRDFFPSFQEEIFFEHLGIYLVVLYLLAVVSYYFFSKKFHGIQKSLVVIVVIWIVIQTGDLIFHRSNDFGKVIIWSVRANDTSEPWVDSFIDGRNLKELPFVGKVLVNGVEQRVIRWSDKEIIFRTNPQVTTSGRLEIVTDDGRRSNSLDYKYFGNR